MITTHTPPRSADRVPPAPAAEEPTRADRLAERVLPRTLSVMVGLVVLAQLVGWLPHYLTWPWWADHDVFATLALGWDRGVMPYRDLACNNFPGTIYVYWVVGRLAGWGWSPAINALDAGLLLIFGAVVLAWSRRRFGLRLPGTIGFAAFASYYFGLDYTLAGQRDWQGPCLAVVSLLLLDGWPSRATRWVSALGLSLAFALRPQVVLLGPAFLLALDDARRRWEDEQGVASDFRRTLISVSEWGAALVVGLVLAFLPLILSDLMGDFLTSLRHVAYGGNYNRNGPLTAARRLMLELLPFASWCVPALVVLFASRSDVKLQRLARTGLAAYFAVLLYKPLSPIPAPYLDLPLRLLWSLLLALIVGLVVNLKTLAPTFRLSLVLAALAVGVTTQPHFFDPARSFRALADLRHGGEPTLAPPGYTHHYRRRPYPWKDYRDVLAYLRAHTSHTTRVANALKHDTAIPGAVGRLPAFSAESITWLRLVNPSDETRFVSTLEQANDSVVVWAPSEAKSAEQPSAPSVFAAIERLYDPEARFGLIEVWRRKATTQSGGGRIASAQVE